MVKKGLRKKIDIESRDKIANELAQRKKQMFNVNSKKVSSEINQKHAKQQDKNFACLWYKISYDAKSFSRF